MMTYRSITSQPLCLSNRQARGPLVKDAVKEGLNDTCINYDRPRLCGGKDAMKISLLNAHDGVLQDGQTLPCIQTPLNWVGRPTKERLRGMKTRSMCIHHHAWCHYHVDSNINP